MQNAEPSFSIVSYHLLQPESRRESGAESGKSLETALESDNEGPPFKPITEESTASAISLLASKLYLSAKQRNAMD